MTVKMGWILIASACIALGGCAAQQQAIQPVEPQQSLKAYPKSALEISAPAAKIVGTANSITVLNIRTTSRDDLLRVQIELKNGRGRRDVLDYRMRWLDSNGVQVIPYAPWEQVALEGGEQSLVELTVPTPMATDFRFEIKPHY